ncbi:MAG TPA: aconitase family protein, partial [Pirellulales bacterium]|nr:aconitase family protein [Pirellulales bacterium]
ELGATSTVFPADGEVRRYLRSQGREDDWSELLPDRDASYDVEDEIDLAQLEPLIALPSSPDKVVPVREVAGRPIYQAYIGSSANPGYRDFAIAAEMVKGKRIDEHVSFDVNPTSRQILENLARDGHLLSLLHAGARLHQAGCGGCIGMGQAPASGRLSLRTVPRNFPGRSGTEDDQVCLVSPETAAASALRGEITDPRSLDFPYPHVAEPEQPLLNRDLLLAPLPAEEARGVLLVKGKNIAALPELESLPEVLEAPVLLRVGDHISTDEIMPAGAKVLPFRSNIPKISEFVFHAIDAGYASRARQQGDHAIIAGHNYGQGSSREHAALAPRYLGLRLVIAKSFARIHWQNLINFGVLPLVFSDELQYDQLVSDCLLKIEQPAEQLQAGKTVVVQNVREEKSFETRHQLSDRQLEVAVVGGLINWTKRQQMRG